MKSIEEKEAYFEFLYGLRETGITNMFGAGPYLQVAFPELTKVEAKNILVEWMQSFRKKEV